MSGAILPVLEKSNPENIYPTHSCFDDAMEYIESRVTEDPTLVHDERLVMTHALIEILNGPHQGQIGAHAWAEENGEYIQMGIYQGERVWVFRTPEEVAQTLRIVDATRYTLKEVHCENVRSGHFGPWKPEHIEHCRDRLIAKAALK